MPSPVEIHQAAINTIFAPSNNSAMISRVLKNTTRRKGPMGTEPKVIPLQIRKRSNVYELYTTARKCH